MVACESVDAGIMMMMMLCFVKQSAMEAGQEPDYQNFEKKYLPAARGILEPLMESCCYGNTLRDRARLELLELCFPATVGVGELRDDMLLSSIVIVSGKFEEWVLL